MNSKQEIRELIRSAFKTLSPERKAEMDKRIRALVGKRIALTGKKPCTVLMYRALGDEADLDPMMPELLGQGYTVLLPVVSEDRLVLRRYTGETGLLTGAFGISEPSGEEFTDPGSIDLAFIPGRAFSPEGARLGRGKGYYDRLLPELGCPKIGVGLPFQLIDGIPAESHDIPMDEVLT